jgi:hypothetical protein
MTRHRLRFGLRSSSRVSDVFVIVASGAGDVYLFARPLGGMIKASLHHDGNWQYGFTQEFHADTGLPNQARHLDKWKRQRVSPMTHCYRIEFFESELRPPGPKFSSAGVTWLPDTIAGQMSAVDVWLSDPGVTVRGWPGVRHGSNLLARWLLPSGELFVVASRQEVSAGAAALLQSMKTQAIALGAADRPRPRALIMGDGSDGSRLFSDIALDFS